MLLVGTATGEVFLSLCERPDLLGPQHSLAVLYICTLVSVE